jgi:hypothetical protein
MQEFEIQSIFLITISTSADSQSSPSNGSEGFETMTTQGPHS